jgi:hypothetical protein
MRTIDIFTSICELGRSGLLGGKWAEGFTPSVCCSYGCIAIEPQPLSFIKPSTNMQRSPKPLLLQQPVVEQQ